MKRSRILIYGVLGASLLLWIVPFYILGAVSVNADMLARPPEWFPSQPSIVGYEAYFYRSGFGRWVLNSFIYSISITAGSVAISVLAGYAFSRLQFRGKTVLFWLVLIGMMMPAIVYYIPLFITMARLQLVDTYAGMILPLLVNPFSVFLVKQAFDGVPRDFEEAAVVDGASPYQIMFSVMLPLVRPVMITVLLFNFIWSWNNWIWPLFVLSNNSLFNLPIAVWLQSNTFTIIFQNVAAGGVLAAIVPLILYIIALDYFMKGVVLTGLKG